MRILNKNNSLIKKKENISANGANKAIKRIKESFLLIFVSTLFILFGLACAKPSDGTPTAQTTPGYDSRGVDGTITIGTPNGGGTTTDPYSGKAGASVDFTMDSWASFNTYVAKYPINNPTNLKLYVEVRDIGSGKYAGMIEVYYIDNGAAHRGHFESGTGTNKISYQNRDVGKSEAEFNQWFNWGGKSLFHGFFQDSLGAVILVIDGGIDEGDGKGWSAVNGSLWFKNFAVSQYPQTAEKCWFIRVGPYDCRTFRNGNDDIYTSLSLYPNTSDGYQKLLNFTGLDNKKAFGK